MRSIFIGKQFRRYFHVDWMERVIRTITCLFTELKWDYTRQSSMLTKTVHRRDIKEWITQQKIVKRDEIRAICVIKSLGFLNRMILNCGTRWVDLVYEFLFDGCLDAKQITKLVDSTLKSSWEDCFGFYEFMLTSSHVTQCHIDEFHEMVHVMLLFGTWVIKLSRTYTMFAYDWAGFIKLVSKQTDEFYRTTRCERILYFICNFDGNCEVDKSRSTSELTRICNSFVDRDEFSAFMSMYRQFPCIYMEDAQRILVTPFLFI
jgi:hypothetical protein